MYMYCVCSAQKSLCGMFKAYPNSNCLISHIVEVINLNGLLHYLLECLVETLVKLGMFTPYIFYIVSYLCPFSSPHMSTDTGLIIFAVAYHNAKLSCWDLIIILMSTFT